MVRYYFQIRKLIKYFGFEIILEKGKPLLKTENSLIINVALYQLGTLYHANNRQILNIHLIIQ